MLAGNATGFVHTWTQEQEAARVAALERGGKVLQRRYARAKAWDDWGQGVTVLGLFVLGMLTMMYLVTYGPHWSGFPLLLDGAWRFVVAGLPAGVRASWHWLVGWTRPYVPPHVPSGLLIPSQSRFAHAIAAHWGHIVVVTAGLLLIIAFLWAGQVFTAFWVFVFMVLLATFGLPLAQTVFGAHQAPISAFTPWTSGGYPGY